MKTLWSFLVWLLALSPCHAAFGQVLLVGQGKPFASPRQAATQAKNGDIVEIDAGSYARDTAIWRADNLVIRGVGGMVHLDSQGHVAEDKAIWVIKGRNTTVENIIFSGARAANRNGAGIRQEGAGLTVRNCLFRHNENGILTGAKPGSSILIEESEFDGNGHGDGQSHNIYIGAVDAFTLRASYIHHARVGHQVKSRAAWNLIQYNRISDEADGRSSYLIDLPAGGLASIIGNVLQQGGLTENSAMLAFGMEHVLYPVNQLTLIHNTFVNERPDNCKVLVVQPGLGRTTVLNNIFSGCEKIDGPLLAQGNAIVPAEAFANASHRDYRLDMDTRALHGVELTPTDRPRLEYVHPISTRPRQPASPPTPGAFELAL